VQPGFERRHLRSRYDVASIREDDWHTYSGLRTQAIIRHRLANAEIVPNRLLNAGSGAYDITTNKGGEVKVDLFTRPLVGHRFSVCASVIGLPFAAATFGCAICVGEVLGYCDPARAISEFGRVLAPRGLLICDFGSSLSFRHKFTKTFGRAADMIVDRYNGAPENIWVYNPAYIRELISNSGFLIQSETGTHCWSSIVRRLGLSPEKAVAFEKRMNCFPSPERIADIVTIVAARSRVV
jgi:SAM-dependent methyltransferase